MPGIYVPTTFAARLRDFPMEFRPLIKSLMDDAARSGEMLSQRLVPVATGDLLASIAFRATTNHGWNFILKAEATEDYASFVESGTSRMAPRPYLMPGVELAADQVELLIGEMVDEFL